MYFLFAFDQDELSDPANALQGIFIHIEEAKFYFKESATPYECGQIMLIKDQIYDLVSTIEVDRRIHPPRDSENFWIDELEYIALSEK